MLERARIGETWRTQRWDTFRLNSSNTRSMLPGDVYSGPEPLGALTQHEFVAYMEDYLKRNRLPVKLDQAVLDLSYQNGRFQITTARNVFTAFDVVVATGDLNQPRRPPCSKDFPETVVQIDCSAYRSAISLPAGAVLVVGSGQSGGQVAEDLARAGSRVFLATSRTGRLVRRYRGDDMLNWLTWSGYADVPRNQLMQPSGKPPPRGILGALHTISLQSLSAQGIVLLGRLNGVQDGKLGFDDDVEENIRFANEASNDVKRFVDAYIQRNGIEASDPEDDPAETVAPKLPIPAIRALDLQDDNVASVIWCTGFRGDFSWIKVPGALDAHGQPVHEDGLGVLPGLYFAGLDFGSTRKSGTIPAIAEEASALVRHLAQRRS